MIAIKLRLFLLLMFAVMLTQLAAQTPLAEGVSVSGKIYSSDGEAIKEARITLLESRQETVTDKKGAFSFSNVQAGTYTLTCFAWGLKTFSRTIAVGEEPLKVDIEMQPFEEKLEEITVKAEKDNEFGITRLKSVEGTAIYAGKKNEVVVMEDVNANLATNNSRQIYAKVAGLNIWENDGAGIQLGIGGRGLSPNRSSNFNMRQNQYDISADALGYPESYYSPPAEAIEQIEIVRGAASLQYGPQFGGMINFRLKKGPSDKILALTSRQTVGSFGLFNSFNSIGGTKGKFNYYTFFQYKTGNGWRPNSQFDTYTAHGNVHYQLSSRLTLSAEYTFMNYLAHQPGGLTDALFAEDPRQSIRDRNWFRVNWNLASFSLNYRLTDKTTVNAIFFGLQASREALGFLGHISRVDPMEERNLLSDHYLNFGQETRLLHRYQLFGKNTSAFLIGGRYYQGFTDRKQGNADAGSEATFQFLNPEDPGHSEYEFPSRNLAFFAENLFQVTPLLSITPGLRYEHIYTSAEGYYKVESTNLADSIIYSENIPDRRSSSRSFLLAGIGMSFKPVKHVEVYGNFSQNYRSINFNDMRIVNPNFRVDPQLEDENGFSADLGFRGNIKNKLNYDISIFLLHYNDRIGEVLRTDSVLFAPYRYRTNISDSRNYGLETFIELNINQLIGQKDPKNNFSVFSNLSLMDARYVNSEEAAFDGKKVELVPPVIFKTGISWKREQLKVSWQYAYTSSHYTDATNAEFTPNAVNGIVPDYYVMDLSLQYTYSRYSVEGGVNNLTNNIYFTRRASGYPGPGIIPSDGRNFYITLQVKL